MKGAGLGGAAAATKDYTAKTAEAASKIKFAIGPLAVRSLTTQDLEELLSLFIDQANPATHLYADGTHCSAERVAKKVDLWGGRDETDNLFRCFLFYHQDDTQNEPIGFINFGRTTIQYAAKPTIEFGLLFKAGTTAELKQLAVRAVLEYLSNPTDYAIVKQGNIKEFAALVGTTSREMEGVYEAFKANGFFCTRDMKKIQL